MDKPDKIALIGLEFRGHHGVFPEEARLGARFLVDVEMTLEFSGEDALEKTVNYGVVYQLVSEEVSGKRYKLIETLAQRIAKQLLSAHPLLHEVSVRVHKPHAPLSGIFRDIYVEVTRTRQVEKGDSVGP